MNNKPSSTSTNFVFIFVVIALLAPPVSQAQTYWLQYSMTVGSTDSGTQNNSYDSGKVQSTNLVTANLAGSGAYATASATPSASFGRLQITANCSIDNPTWNGNGHICRFESDVGGGPDVSFQDQLTITSATLPTGTSVRIQIVCVTAGSITPGTGSGLNFTTSSSSVQLTAGNRPAVTAAIGSDYATNIISTIVTNTVGSQFNINFQLSAQGWAENNSAPGFVGSVSTAITSQTYVSVLTAGASYTSASGTVYPAVQLPPPAMSIQFTSHTAIISWPTAYLNFALKQNSSFNPATWSDVTNAVVQVGNENEITIPSPTGTVFYRLQGQ